MGHGNGVTMTDLTSACSRAAYVCGTLRLVALLAVGGGRSLALRDPAAEAGR